MRKVIDSNILQSEQLRAYLGRSRDNYAVLTDYAAMEAYKGDTLQSIYKSMAILMEHPKQVIVLRGTQTICGLRGRAAGLQRRMIDQTQTKGFAQYCRDLRLAQNGNTRLQGSLVSNGRVATEHIDRLLVDARHMPEIFDDIARTYSREELKLLRTRYAVTDEMLCKTLHNVRGVIGALCRDHPKVTRIVPRHEFGNTYLFRFGLCAYIWALRWVSVGGALGAKPEKVRNDMVDINFVVYGTFFDGLLSDDAKAMDLHRDMVLWLQALGDYSLRSHKSNSV